MKHQTSIRVSKRLYLYFRELQLFQKVTISKTALYILENYNQQIATQGKNHQKEKKEVEKKKKRGKERHNIRSGTQSIPSKHAAPPPPPPNVFPNPTPSNGRTRKQHNSKKWQSNETKRWPMTTKQTSHNGNQTLKLYHVRTPTLAKAERKTGAVYNIHPRRKAVIYKKAWTPWEVTQSVPILHRPTLKLCALS